MKYFRILKESGAWGNVDLNRVIVCDGVLYFMRNMKSKIFHEQYGYFGDEKAKEEKLDIIYENMKNAGIKVIPCIVL